MPTPDEIVAQLHPPRLPVNFSEVTWQDACGAFGIGVLIGIVIYAVLRLLLTRRESFADRAEKDLKSWRDLPGPERHYRQTRLWVEICRRNGAANDALPIWMEDLYRPDHRVDHEALDGEIRDLLRKRRA